MVVLAPDVIASQILERITYQGTEGVSFDKLWQLVPTENDVTPLYKSIVYSWIKHNSNLEVTFDGKVIPTPKTFDESPEGALIRITEEYQWLVLTGFPKENNSIGNAAFQLLCEIAKAGATGIDSLTLTQVTAQDQRSLTSRIKVISHLIKRLTVLKKGRTLSQFIFNKFFDEDLLKDLSIPGESSNEITINLNDFRERIVTTLKNSKSGIRQLADLRRELEMDKSKKQKIIFKSTITFLEAKGHIGKLLVVSSASPTKKIRSLKFLKDYVKDKTPEVDDDDEEQFFNTDLIDDDLKDLDEDEEEDEQGSSVINNNIADVEFLEATTSNIHIPNLNRFYPMQNQLYEAVQNHGQTGCSSNYLTEEFFGTEYSRLFTKIIESYTSGKLLPHLSDLGIIRHYDFNGRTKFYRYITRPHFLKLTHKPADVNGFSLPPFKTTPKQSLSDINRKNFTSLGTKVDTFIDTDGTKKIIWYGESSKTNGMIKEEHVEETLTDLLASTKKRGRPRKGEEKSKTTAKKSKKNQVQEEVGNSIDVAAEEIEKLQQIINQTEVQNIIEPIIEEPETKLIVSDIQATSFKAMERQAAILRLLDDSDGVVENNIQLVHDVREELGYIVDRKTFNKDVNSLIAQQKLFIEDIVDDYINDDLNDEAYHEDDDVKVVRSTSLLISTNASFEAIENMKRVLKESMEKKSRPQFRILEEINLDIDFFDTELRESFNKVPTPKLPPSENPPDVKKQERSLKPKNPISKPPTKPKVKQSKAKQKFTGKKEATETFDPSNTTVDELFENVRTKVRPNFRISKELKEDSLSEPQGRKRRNLHNLTSAQSLTLFKAVIICKTINENQINWVKISKLLRIDANILRTKWPRIRMMMGPTGIKVAKRNWKKILLRSVKEGRIGMNDIESLQLEQLIDLWYEFEESYMFTNGGDSLTGSDNLFDENKLYVNIEDNYKHYKFTKTSTEGEAKANYDSNSMVQREQYLINSVFTYDELDNVEEKTETIKDFEKIRNTIIAIVSSTGGNHSEITKLHVLEQFNEGDVNAVFLKLVKNRQVVIAHQNVENHAANSNCKIPPMSKVVIGDKFSSLLEDNTFDFSLPKLPKFQEVLQELLESGKGLILNPLFDNSYMVPILELIKDSSMNLTRVDHYRKEVLSGYEARTLERQKLDSDILLTSLNNELIKPNPEKLKEPIPRGKPCSHIWIDIAGEINVELWSKVLKIIVSTLICKPGITNSSLEKSLSPVLSKHDLKAIMDWLEKNKAIKRGEFDGYWLQSQWYMALGF